MILIIRSVCVTTQRDKLNLAKDMLVYYLFLSCYRFTSSTIFFIHLLVFL